jgi:hypothetical protein
METIYNELQETLQLVAETSVQELAETQNSLKQLNPDPTQGSPPSEPTGEQTTSGSPPKEGSNPDLEAPSDVEDVEPASTEVPPLSDPGRLTAVTWSQHVTGAAASGNSRQRICAVMR